MVKVEFMKTFIEVVRVGSLRKAAKNLGLSVSTVSFQISALESFYGAKLLKRNINGIELTEEGKIVLKNIEMIIKSIEDVKRIISKNKKIILASGVVGLNVVYLLQNVIKSKYPDVEMRIELKGSQDCIYGLLDGRYDFAIVGDVFDEQMKEKLFIEKIGKDKLVLITSKDHPLAKKDSVCLDDIKKEKLAMLTENYGITVSTKKALKMSGKDISNFNVLYVVNDYYTKLDAVSSGVCVAITSLLAACKAYEVGLIEIKEIVDLKTERDIYFASLKTTMENEKMREYAEVIISEGRKLFEDYMRYCKNLVSR